MNTATVMISLLAAGIAAGCTAERDLSASHPPPTQVPTVTARTSAIASTIEAGGVVRARVTAPIASRMMAPILRIDVRVGDHVKRGALLVELDARQVDANRVGAGAALTAAGEAASAAEADAQAADAALVIARTTHDRIAGLFAKRSATAAELDQAVAGLRGAEAQRAAATARLSAARAGRDSAAAAAEAARVAASYAQLTAPFDGIVSERHTDPGAMAMPGVPLLVLEQADAWQLAVEVDEARADYVRSGDAVDVRIDGASNGDWTAGRTAEISRVEPTSHSFLVKIDLPSGAPSRSGVFGRARFAGPSRTALTVPMSALVRRGQLTFVFIVDGGEAKLRPVSLGAAAGDRVEILAGLRDGEAIVATPDASIADGRRVAGASR